MSTVYMAKGDSNGNPISLKLITRLEAEELKSTSSFVPGLNYTITDTDVNLYGGTEITLTAITPSELSLQGSGLFYCPKYDLTTPGYGIWTTYMEGFFSNVVGTFTSGENVTANNGATAIYLAESFLNYVSGDFSDATSILGQSSGATADISDFVSPSYSVGQIVHWGGKSWTNVNGNVGSSIDKYTLDAEWQEIPFNETDYNVYIDEIHYDFGNDMIIYRKDRYNNVVSGSNQVFVEFESPDGYGYGNPIKDFQWGCAQDNFNTDDYLYVGIQGNQVIDSYFETLNILAKYIWNNELSQQSYIYNNTLSSNSVFYSNTLSNSYIQSNTLSSNSSIQNNTFSGGSSIENNTFSGGSSIDNNNLSGINSSDETTSSIQTKRPIKTVNGESLEGNGNLQIDYNDLDNLPTLLISNHSGLNLDDGTNPHGTTKSDVGLGNVDNTSDVNKPISIEAQQAFDSKQDKLNETNFGQFMDGLDSKTDIKDVDVFILSDSEDSLKSKKTRFLDLKTKLKSYFDTFYLSLSIFDNFTTATFDSLDNKLDKSTTASSVYGTDVGGGQTMIPFSTLQPTLISGTNIKTLEGQSLVGSGNINLTSNDVGLGNVDNTSDLNKPISTATLAALNLKLSTEAPSTTGTVISFSTDKVYGTLTTPETGNITADVTNAKLGVTNIIIHNSGTAPTFGSEFKKLSGSGNYTTGVVNYIYCTFISATEIIYSINQRT